MRIRLLFGSIFLLSTGCFGTTATYYLSSLKTSLGQAIVDMHGLKTINFYVNQQESYTSDDSITFTTTTVFNNNVKLHVLHKDQVISNSISFDANGHLIVSDTNHLLSSKIGSYYNILVYASNDDGSIRSSPEKDRSYFDLHITPKPASVSIDSEISVDRNLSKSSPIDFNINVAHASPVVFDENNQELMFNE
jgi:hypothetical protein